jgi:predicted Zn-dependent peptidase
MKKIIALLLLCSVPGYAQKIQIPPVTRDTLDNGLTVIMMEYRKVPVVDFRMVVRGGSAHDPDDLPGIAGMMASLMREGTETRNATRIAEEIDFIGGSLSVRAGLDYTAATMEVLSKDTDAGLDLFADVILHPSFPEDEIDREREQRLAELDALKEDPSTIASMVFTSGAYGSHPYGRQSIGTRNSLQAISRDALKGFYGRIFVPGNAILAVVGDFQRKEMLEKIKARFSTWPAGTVPGFQPVAPAVIKGRTTVLVNKPDATQTQIRIGNTGVDIRNPDYIPLLVANTVFGGGFTSRLIDELRVKRSLTYSAWSGFSANMWGGSFSISTFTKNATVTEALDVVLSELEKLRTKGVTKEELAKAQNYMAGNFARDLQTPDALASQLTDIDLYGFPPDYLETYIQKIRQVTAADLQRVIGPHFHLDDLLFVLVGPEDLKGKLARYGSLSVIQLSEAVK